MKNRVYYLERPGGRFIQTESSVKDPHDGEIRLRIARTSVCQSDVIIHRQGLPRIKEWPAILLHEVSAYVDAVGPGVEQFAVGDLIGLGCDLPCPDAECPYCGDSGTGDWTSCPNTHATGHEYPGFAREFAILPKWFVDRGPIVRFPSGFDPNLACHVEPLACCLEGMTRVGNCIENRVIVLIGAGSQSVYALQCAISFGARKIIVVNRGRERLYRVSYEFDHPSVVGVPWTEHVVADVLKECIPFPTPHFIMVNAPAREGYELGVKLMGPGTVLDLHAGVKGINGKPEILHTVDLNNDVHYRLQCYQATHGSSMRSIRLARQMLAVGALPNINRMTRNDERFEAVNIGEAFVRASESDSLKVVINWD